MGAISKRNIIGRLAAVDSSAIRVDQARCAKVRNRNVECLKCAQACTSGCISLVDGELTVDSSKCVGCGTCATVCPTCALEARNPSDAELLNACLAARRGDTVDICCSRIADALAGLLDENAFSQVVCLGRVDETLLCELAEQGVARMRLFCGDCSACAQRFGRQTAEMVAQTAADIFDAWGIEADVVIRQGVPREALADGADAGKVEAAVTSYFSKPCSCPALEPEEHQKSGSEDGAGTAFPLPHVMGDGTLPHFVPDRRERLLNALSSFGEARKPALSSRLWGCVVIDGTKCSSCRMCATFCPTGAITKFDDEDGTMGVTHRPEDCVKCGSCRDICPEEAILLLDEVKTGFLMGGKQHRYTMTPRPVKLDDPHQILNAMKDKIEGNVYER